MDSIEELEEKLTNTESHLIAMKLQYDLLREQFILMSKRFNAFDSLPQMSLEAKYEFDYMHHAALKERITVNVDSAGTITKAELVSRLLGKNVDVTFDVLNCPDLKKIVMNDFYDNECERKIKEFK